MLFFTKPKKGLFETAMAFSIPQLDGLAFAGVDSLEMEQKKSHFEQRVEALLMLSVVDGWIWN